MGTRDQARSWVGLSAALCVLAGSMAARQTVPFTVTGAPSVVAFSLPARELCVVEVTEQ